MNRKEYSAGAVKHSFWFMEFRKVVSLRLEGKTWEEIKRLNEEENIFGAPTTLRATQIFNTVSARVKAWTIASILSLRLVIWPLRSSLRLWLP